MPSPHPKRGVPWAAIAVGLVTISLIAVICFVIYTFAAQEQNGGPFYNETAVEEDVSNVETDSALHPPTTQNEHSFRVPRGTPNELVDAVSAAFRTPYDGIIGSVRPGGVGWAKRTPPMARIVAFGDDAVPIMVANLNNEQLRYTAIRALGDLKAKEAVPALVEHLELSDSMNDLAIMNTLSRITGLNSFHRTWFAFDRRMEALAEYTNWCKTHGLRRPRKVDIHAHHWANLKNVIAKVESPSDKEGQDQSDRLTAPIDRIVRDFRAWLEEHNHPHLIRAWPRREADSVTLSIWWIPDIEADRDKPR